MKPNPSESCSPEKSLSLLALAIQPDLKNIREKSNPCSRVPPQSEVNMTSPVKQHVLKAKASVQSKKTLLSQIVKFDFSFKKKTNLKSKESPEEMLQELCQKINVSSEGLDRKELESILQIANEKQNYFQNIFCKRIPKSAFIVCQILRGKLNPEISLMKTLNLIWDNCLSKKNFGRILKIVDYKMILAQSFNSEDYSISQKEKFKNLKVSFVNVSFDYLYCLY